MSVYYEFFPKALYVVQLYENGQVALPLDNGGFVMTREEWKEIRTAFDKFFATDAYLEYNENRQRQLEQGQGYGQVARMPKNPKAKPGYVYFVKSTETNFVKIGRTTNLKSRIKSMQTVSPFELELFASYETTDSEAEEILAHDFFEDHHKRGEWFEISDCEILDFIKERETNDRGNG